ncbi:MAG: ATP-binding protein [Rhodospirillaceae bacterium]|nr:ATP-binding protein [Rhodospirillaceae bacterium]MDE0619322.1 ATP-binding protein [Rhodospirillaceae bacterium]
MTAVLSKPADRIDAGDIQALIDESVPEGAQIEFKESLPARGTGDPDPWIQGDGRIGDRARNEILKEVVAFANAYGGALVLGIAEDGAKPPVAANVTPLPRCADLGERFRLVFRDSVEPQLPTLDIVPVPTNGDDGVIVFRTSQSRLGPHRVTSTLVCPIRRADRCEPLSMREIRDMTLNLARDTERLERRLRERAAKFEEEFKRLTIPNDAFGFRVTALPVGDEIKLDSLFSASRLIPELRPPKIKLNRTKDDEKWSIGAVEDHHKVSFENWRPLLRAARSEDSWTWGSKVEQHAYSEIYCSGNLEISLFATRLYSNYGGEHEGSLYAGVPASILAQILVWSDQIRQQADAPGAEFVVQLQLVVTAEKLFVDASGMFRVDTFSYVGQENQCFPEYFLNDSRDIHRTVSLFERDFWNFLGGDIAEVQGALEIVPA